MKVQLQNCLTLALDGGESLAWRPGRFTTRKISALYPLNWRRSGRFGEEKIFFPCRDSIRESSSPLLCWLRCTDWLSAVRVKIYRSSVTRADVNIVVPTLWENRLSQHLGAGISGFLHTSRTPLPFQTTRGRPEHHNSNFQRPENLHSSSNDTRMTGGEHVRRGKISVVAYLEDLSSFIPPFLWQNC